MRRGEVILLVGRVIAASLLDLSGVFGNTLCLVPVKSSELLLPARRSFVMFGSVGGMFYLHNTNMLARIADSSSRYL